MQRALHIPDRRRSRKLASSSRKNYSFATGQSLAAGAFGTPALSTSQPYSNQATTRLGVLSPYTSASDGADQERPSCAFINSLTFLSPAQAFASIHRFYGAAGTAYSGLKKGGSSGVYEEHITTITNLHNAQIATGGIRCVCFMVVHGETDDDLDTTYAQYLADLKEWVDNFDTDIRAITGQAERVLLITDQLASFTKNGNATSGIPIAQLSASRERDYINRIFCAGPKYQFSYHDGVHLADGTQYRRCGEQLAKVADYVLRQGKIWYPLSPGAVHVNGNDIEIAFRVPAPPLVFDTTRVALKANYGFEYYDPNGGGPVINGLPSLIDGYRVRVPLSGPPRSGSRIRYAFTGTPGHWAGPGFGLNGANDSGSARGNLRDSDSSPSLYGNEMFNWCVHFDEATGV